MDSVGPDLLAVAIEYVAARGWSVIPVHPRSKKPAVAWEEFQRRHAGDDELESWFGDGTDHNIGIVCGKISGNLVVLDADGEEGERTLAELKLPHTLRVRTAKGTHAYLRGSALATGVRRLPGVDVRAEGGYVVAPPSVHETGLVYEWLPACGPDEVDVAPLPKGLRATAARPRPKARKDSEPIREGERNDRLASLAGRLRRVGLSEDELLDVLRSVNQHRCSPPLPADELRTIAASVARYEPRERAGEAEARGLPTVDRTMPGGTFALDVPDLADVTLWGRDSQVLWIRGEPFLIVGPTGACKTTLAWNLMLSLIRLREPELLGLPVRPIQGRVLYIAADRPDQARRALRRMVAEEDRATLDERLSVWRGPLLFDVSRDPDQLVSFVKERGAEVVFIDSLKDVATDLAKDEGGSRLNRAAQLTVSSGIELAGLHHHRKASGENKRPNTLDDVYGSVWIVAGAGSVTCLWGKPGDTTVEFSHLKMPAEEVGPFTVTVNHTSGILGVADGTGPLSILRASTQGVTAGAFAAVLFGTDEPDRNQVEKARRKLQRLEGLGQAHRRPGGKDEQGRQRQDAYFAVVEDEGQGVLG